MKTLIRSINRSPLRCGFFTVAIALTWFALSPPLKAVTCPDDCDNFTGKTALGFDALASNTGINNTAVGDSALQNNTNGGYNVAIGGFALRNNHTGQQNMAIGAESLLNSNGNFNLAIGFRTAFMNTTGNRLTAIGAAALRNNTTASDNTASGSNALRENTTSQDNVAVGDSALASYNGLNAGIDGFNTALGSIALTDLTSGFQNTAVGRRALEFLTTGNNNTAVGWRTGDGITTGSGNIFIGVQAGATAPMSGTYNNTILLGITGDSNANAPSGRCYIGHIRDVAPSGPGVNEFVIIDPDGQLGSIPSARRFKKDIEPMNQASEDLLKLKPVTFHYKNQDGKNDKTPQFGLVAEDVEQVNRDLVVYDKEGQLRSVRYDAVYIMVVNEFLKEHKKVEEQQASITDLKSTVTLLTAQLKEQAAQIQKVSAQLEASKPAPKVVANK